MPFALRAEAVQVDDSPFFAAQPYSVPVAFEHYAVYVSNSGDKPVKANLYVYLPQ